jgi:hypothetical protein
VRWSSTIRNLLAAVMMLIVYAIRPSFDGAGWHTAWLAAMWITVGASLILCHGRRILTWRRRWHASRRQPASPDLRTP